MKRSLFTLIFSVAILHSGFGQPFATLSVKDFNLFTGSWTGSLTYADYSSDRSVTIPAKIKVTQLGKNKIVFYNTYPDEPKANSADTITISRNGKMINKERVKSVRTLTNGDKEIITVYSGTDGNDDKPAVMRHTYTAGKNIFIKRKDVQFTGQKNWLKRNEYRYTRK